MSFDVHHIRQMFPALRQGVAYLDTSASALKPQIVIDTMRDVMETHYANIHRGLYAFSQKTTLRYEQARQKIAEFIGANKADEIVFTRNGTEAINLVASSWGNQNLQKGDIVLISELEHHANIVPWYLLKEKLDIEIDVIPMLDNGDLDQEAFLEKIKNPAVKMLAVTQMSNAIGTIVPVSAMIKEAKQHNVTTLIDGCQGVMHMDVDVQKMGCDFYVFSGHKLYGPSGVGVLYGKQDLLNSMPPYQGGGDMIDRVSFDKITFKEAPGRFEAGTPAIVDAIGLGAAVGFLNEIGMDQVKAHEQVLLDYLLQSLKQVEGLTVIGDQINRGGAVSFLMDNIHPSDIATILDKENIAVRVGHHCAEPLMDRLGITGTVRASLGLYNTNEDVDRLIAGLNKVKKFF